MQFYTGDFTANVNEYNAVDTTSGGITCTLPDTTNWGDDNFVYLSLWKGSNSITINGTAGQTINGSASLTLMAASTPPYLKLAMGSGNWYTF